MHPHPYYDLTTTHGYDVPTYVMICQIVWILKGKSQALKTRHILAKHGIFR